MYLVMFFAVSVCLTAGWFLVLWWVRPKDVRGVVRTVVLWFCLPALVLFAAHQFVGLPAPSLIIIAIEEALKLQVSRKFRDKTTALMAVSSFGFIELITVHQLNIFLNWPTMASVVLAYPLLFLIMSCMPIMMHFNTALIYSQLFRNRPLAQIALAYSIHIAYNKITDFFFIVGDGAVSLDLLTVFSTLFILIALMGAFVLASTYFSAANHNRTNESHQGEEPLRAGDEF